MNSNPAQIIKNIESCQVIYKVIYIVLNLMGLNLSEKLIKNEVVIKLFSALCVGIGVFGIAYF